MRHGLNRIESNLNNLAAANTTAKPQPDVLKRTYSFEIHNAAAKTTGNSPTQSQSESSSKLPTLPQFNFNHNRSDRLVANSASNMNQAPATQIDVASCEARLRLIVEQIEQLYLEGPIIDGWLEFSQPTPESTTILNPLAVEQLTDYREDGNFASEKTIDQLPNLSYLLCGLNATNQKWSYPCPPEQLLDVSMAIARYHKLRQLLQQKQYFETCL